jgi:photosystem II stability/assembly factor-like uncharacterized protein
MSKLAMKLFWLLFLLFATAANAQWEKVPVPTTASLRGLSVVNQKVVWVSGTGGTVIRTVDGGKNWAVMTVPGAESLDLRGIRAFDDKTAVIISSGPAEKGQAHIYRTGDGGKTWQPVFEEKRAGIFFDAVAFWDRQHGIVLSDPVDGKFALFTTGDGGATWKQIPASALPAALANEGAFAASNSCLTVQGVSNAWFATGGANVARVFRSDDRGKTWQAAETPMRLSNASSGIFSLAFQDERNGVAVGGDYQKPESSELPNVLFTMDGGQSWQVGSGTDPSGMYLSSVVGVPTVGPHTAGWQSFIAVGTKGIVSLVGRMSKEDLNTMSGGFKYKVVEEELNSVAIAPDFRKNSIENLWAVGPKGRVVHLSRVLLK